MGFSTVNKLSFVSTIKLDCYRKKCDKWVPKKGLYDSYFKYSRRDPGAVGCFETLFLQSNKVYNISSPS